MTFFDLPDDLAQRPLTEARLVADVLDLVVGEIDRREGCLLMALCDSDGCLVQPCIINEVPDDMSDQERVAMLGVFVEVLSQGEEPGSLLVAIGRAQDLSATAQDMKWVAAAESACRGRVELLGVHLITTEGSRPLPRTSAAA